jgi:hypothetical protein
VICNGGGGSATLVTNLSGSVNGLAPIAGTRTAVAFEGPGTSSSSVFTGTSFTVSAYTNSRVTGTLHALQWSYDAGIPSSYLRYGRLQNVTVDAGVAQSGLNIATSVVGTQLLSGTMVPPSGFTAREKHLHLRFPADGTIDLGTDATTTPTISFPTPLIANTTFDLDLRAQDSLGRSTRLSRRGLTGNASGLTFTFVTPPGLSLPLGGVTGIDLATQRFSWAPMSPAGPYTLVLNSGSTVILVYSTSTSYTLPPTSELGLGNFAPNTTFNWQVSGVVDGITTIDESLAPGHCSYLQVGTPGPDGGVGSSESRTFQTR